MKANFILAALAVILGITAAFTNHSEKTGLYPDWKFETGRVEGQKVHYISASFLADLMYRKDQQVLILDARSEAEYQQYHIPSSLRFKNEEKLIEGRSEIPIILVGGSDDSELARIAGEMEGEVFVLSGGMDQWFELVLFPDFRSLRVRNNERLREIHYRSFYFGGAPKNSQLLNIKVRENRFREGC
jgi:rhodanese-related sulfurtransferase